MPAPTPQPTPDSCSHLDADERGLWRESTAVCRGGIEWGEIRRITAHIQLSYGCIDLFKVTDAIP